MYELACPRSWPGSFAGRDALCGVPDSFLVNIQSSVYSELWYPREGLIVPFVTPFNPHGTSLSFPKSNLQLGPGRKCQADVY